MVDQQPAAAVSRSRTRLAVQAVLSLLLVVAIYYLLHGIDRGQVWVEISAMTSVELVTLLVGRRSIDHGSIVAALGGGARPQSTPRGCRPSTPPGRAQRRVRRNQRGAGGR